MRFALLIIFILTTLLAFYASNLYAQEPPADPCAGITCNPDKLTCLDGFVAECSNSCSNGVCSTCTPSCEGHQVVNKCANVVCEPLTKTCPDSSVVSCNPSCNPETGACGTCELPPCKAIAPICGDGICETVIGGVNEAQTCPSDCPKPAECPAVALPSPDFCPNGKVLPKTEGDCIVGYECKLFPEPVCGDGFCNFNEYTNTCPQDCKDLACPADYNPVCSKDGKTYSNECVAKSSGAVLQCYGECPCPASVQCPEFNVCPDGNRMACRQAEGVCACEPCPVPPECREEKDPNTGLVHVICERQACEPVPKEKVDACRNEGGNPIYRTDPRGCEFVDCTFERPPGFFEQRICPDPQEIDEVMRKCSANNLQPRIYIEGQCKLVTCGEERRGCAEEINPSIKHEIEEKCRREGLGVQKSFDNSGCPITVCSGESVCQRHIPDEAYKKCELGGGELIVQKNENTGCIKFVDCVSRGDKREVGYEEVTVVPDETVLLQLAFKLEELKIKFDELARKTEDIAKYYESAGNKNEAERFRRVSSMFETAKSKIDDVKEELRARIDVLTPGDVSRIKHDIKYIVKVILKDILYVMLSKSEEVKEFAERPEDATGCGYDSSCFDRAFRVCKPTTFIPEKGIRVELVGLENELCILKAESAERPPDFTGDFSMTCKIPDFSLGVKGPEDIMQYCTGPMADAFKSGKFGSGGQTGGPGGCTTESTCREYCENPEHLDECKKFAQVQGLTGPGGCFGQECETFCRQNPEECARWCRENPDKCPQHAVPTALPTSEPSSPFPNEFERDYTQESEFREGNACVGCLNNGVCDPGECSECRDCLRR